MTARFLWRDGRVVGQHELNHLGGPRSGDIPNRHVKETKGTLWEREAERGQGLEVYGHWLVYYDEQLAEHRSYDTPPTEYMSPIRDLTGILKPHEHVPGYECPRCGHLALRVTWIAQGDQWPENDLEHRALAARERDRS